MKGGRKVEFNKEQRKIINYKPHGHLLIKGEKSTGKTTAFINKIPSLLNHYCINKDDKILVAAFDEEQSKHISHIYDSIESEKYHQNSFFDQDNSDKLEIRTVDSLILYYFNQYKEKHKKKITIASNKECEELLKDAIKFIHKKHEKDKLDLLDPKYKKFIQEEIMWIKSCNYLELNDYQNVNRTQRSNKLKGNSKILRKNSKQRQVIHEILTQYNKNLKKINKIDFQDMALLALESAHKKQSKSYTHIFAHDCEKLTKVQLEFLKALHNNKIYSSITFVVNTDSNVNQNAWLIKGRSFAALGYDMKGKSISLKRHFTEKINESKIIMDEIKQNDDIAKYDKNKIFVLDTIEYIDLKRNVSHKFIKDSDSSDEIFIEEDGAEEKVDDVISIPLFNEIAAGSPILINESLEDNYYLPKDWIRNPKNTFILKIKGDSMINKNICDGDYVVINNQNVPNIKDIVAVDIDGDATLKTYKITNGKITLMPENEKYDPIIIDEDKQFSFLGVAIGIIKNS